LITSIRITINFLILNYYIKTNYFRNFFDNNFDAFSGSFALVIAVATHIESAPASIT